MSRRTRTMPRARGFRFEWAILIALALFMLAYCKCLTDNTETIKRYAEQYGKVDSVEITLFDKGPYWYRTGGKSSRPVWYVQFADGRTAYSYVNFSGDVEFSFE